MTKSLQEAFSVLSMNFSPEEQDRFAHLLMENYNRLRDFLEDESEERRFNQIANETLHSSTIQSKFCAVAEKYKNRKQGQTVQ
jgi:hypothetical protein